MAAMMKKKKGQKLSFISVNQFNTVKEFETIKSKTSDKEENKLCISHFLATH